MLILAIWLLSFSLSFISFFDPQINGTKTKGAICTPTFYKNFELVAIAVPLFLTSTFVVIQNIYLYCVVVKITNTYSIGKADDTSGKVGAGMWRKIKETKKASTTLLILSGASVTFGILQPVVTTIIQSEGGSSLLKAIWFLVAIPFIYNVSILLHSVLYGYFLHSIRESLGLKICQ